MIVEAVFESSFGLSNVLFGAVVHANDVFGVTVNVISDRFGFACSVEYVYEVHSDSANCLETRLLNSVF